MDLTRLTTDVAYHQKQVLEPNDVGGLTGPEFQQVCDQGVTDIKDYLNNTLTPQLEGILGTPPSTVAEVLAARTSGVTGEVFGSIGARNDGVDTSLRDITYNVKSFGAKGDGITDDTTSIQIALDTIPLGSTLFFPLGVYKVISTLYLTRKINLKGMRGSSILKGDISTLLSVYTPTPILSTTLNGALSGVTDTLTLNSIAGINSGNMIHILDDSRQWPYDPRAGVFYGEINTINTVNVGSSQITVRMPSATDYPNNTKVYIYDPLSNIKISDITIERTTKTPNTDVGMSLLNTRNICIEDVLVIGFGGAGILDYLSDCNIFQNVSCKDMYYSGIGMGYGIQVGGSIGTIVTNSIFNNCKRGVDFSGTVPSRYCIATNCQAFVQTLYSDEFNGYGTHGSSQYCKFINCIVYGGKNAFLIRGTNITLDSCEAYGTINSFAALGAGYDHNIINCKTDKYHTGDYYTSNFVTISSPDYFKGVKTLIIKNCECRVTDWMIYIQSTTPTIDLYLENLKVYLRFGGKYFISTDNFTIATTFNLNMDSVSITDKNGTRINYLTQPGTNVTINTLSKLGSAYNTTHMILGLYHLWVDSIGRLRIKSGMPTSDTDGTVIGTQS